MENFTLKNTTKTTAKNSSLDSFVSNVSKKRSFSLAASWKLLFLFLVLTVSTSYAQSYREWTSTGTDWNTSSNWNPSGITYGQLEWKGNGNATSNNNVSNPYSSWRFYFSGSKAYTLTGSKVELYDFGGQFSWILSDATANQILNLPIDFNDSGTRYSFITNRSTGTLTFGSGFNVGINGSNIIALRIAGTNAALPAITFNGTISGSRPIDIGKDDSGADQTNTRVFFNGNNSSYSGVTTLYAGTLSIPANTALGSGSLTMGNGTVTNTLAVTDTTTRTQGIVINNTSSAAVIDVASTKTFTMSGVLSGGATNTTKIGKSGPGTLTLSGTATYNGKLQIGDGTVIANNNTAISTNTTTANRGVDLGLNVGGTSQPNNVSLLANNGFTVGNSIYVAPNTSSATRTIGLNGSGSATFDKEIYLDGNLTITGGSGTTTVSGAMVNTGGVIANTGTVVLSAANTYTGTTIVNAGTLTLGAANALPITASAGNIRFTGGTPTLNLGQFSLGSSTVSANSAGLLDFDVNTTVNLGAANGSAYSYYFKDSSAQTWSATTVTIGNWVGTAGATAGTGAGARRIFIGSSASLTTAQLNKIQFTGFAAGANQLASGEIVPRAPFFAITGSSLAHGTRCVGTAATTITYTITNTGANASGVTVTSNNAEFVVSNLSSTTINNGATATYDVTFTPSASGARTADITIDTTTPNGNTPVTSTVTGTGNALPQGSLTANGPFCATGAGQLTWTASAGTGNYTVVYNDGTANRTASSVVSGTAFNTFTTPVTSTTTYTLVSVTDANTCARTTSFTGSSATITVNTSTTSIAPGTTQNIPVSTNGTLLTVTEGTSAFTSRVWKYGTAPGGPYSTSTGVTTTTYTPNFGSTGTYYVVCETTYGSPCSTTITSNEVQINVTSNTITTGTVSGSPFCAGATGVSVPFTYSAPASFPSGGSCTFKAQLSDASGSFASATDLQTVVSDASGSQSISVTIPSGTGNGSGYRIRVVSNSPAVDGTDNGTNLSISATPTTATNGSTQTICTTGTATLSGNNPTVGTGSWSVVSGPSTISTQFASTSVFNTVFTPAGGAGSYVVRWTISNSPCTALTADATITVNAPPTTATNGSTQTICTTGTATLSGNNPSVGTGAWSVVSGPSTLSTQFSNTTTPGAIFTPAGGSGSYVVRWTITNGSCSSTADATITVTSGTLDGFNLQHWSVAPSAQQVCSGSSFTAYGQVYESGLTDTGGAPAAGIDVQFNYNTSDTDPSTWGGTWVAATFGSRKDGNKDEYTYNFNPPAVNTYYFTFRYRLNGCAWQYGGYQNGFAVTSGGGAWNGTTFVNGRADVTSSVANANAGSDISQCNNGSFTMAANAVSSPAVGTWTVVSGTATITSANSATSTITGVPLGTSATLKWRITNGPCNPTEDLVVVTNSATNTWIGSTSTDWNTAANWCGGVPTSASNVEIPSGTTFSPSIYQTANAVANSVNIFNGATLSMSNGYSLSITSGGSITTNSSGTFTAGDGTVNFLGSGTITGTIAFYNVNLSGLVAFSNAVTVNNRLRIAAGGAVTTNSPTYGSGSLLQYFVGASYNRSLEWTTATSGAGYPDNVQISTNGTNTTLNMLTTVAQCSGNLTVDSGNTLNTTSNILTVIGNVLINGTMSLGGDVKTRGNWTVGSAGAQTNNAKAVFFTAATGDQTVTKTGGGTVFFDYLIIDKATSGNLVIESATNITLNTATGRVLQLNNVGGLDLNGRSLTLNNSGGSIYVNGARNIISTPSSPNGTIEINQYKVIENNSGTGTLNLGATVTVNLNTNGNLNFGFSGGSPITTVNGILSINSNTSCFVNTNPPIYSNTSTLIYNSGGTRNRDLEWNATSGAGYPNDVIIQNQTTLEVANGSDTYRKIAGDLTILGAASSASIGCTNCSKLRITNLYTASPAAVSGTTGIGVEIGGDIFNKGRIELKGDTNARLKCTNLYNGDTSTEGKKSIIVLSGDLNATPPFYGNYGGDLEVTADFQDDAVFTSNQRAVFFTGSGVQDVRGSAAGILNIDYVVVVKSGSTNPVRLNKELLIGGPQGGSAVVFYAATDIIDLNGFKLTVGTSGVYSTVVGDGKFKGGSNDSELSILGIGQIGTLNFDNTTPGVTNNLKNLTLNRTISSPTYPTAGFSLGSDVTISNTATLTAGTINLGSANMTIGASASIAVSSPDATKMIIASGTGELRKTFTAAGSFTYPIGDNVGTAEYSPATLTFSGTPSGYAGVRVQNAKHPNINIGIADYITRYWPVSSTIGSPTCDATFTYLSADENGTPANYFGGRYLSSDWYCMDDVDETSRVISKTGLSAFGDFTVYNPPAMTSALTTSAATICANTSTNLQVAIGGGDSPYTVGPFTIVYYDSVLATNVTVNSYTSGANIPVSPTASTTYTLQSVTSSKACYSTASDTKTVSIGGTSTYASGSWTPSAPASTSTAIIDGGTYNAAADITACTLQVKNNAIVTIPSSYKVTLSGALTVETGSSFTLENDTNLVQTGGTTNPNTGSIQVKRNSSSLYLLDYTLWSSSVANQNLYSFSPDTATNRFYIYDEPTDQYNSLSSNNSFTVGRGYLIRVPRTFSATTPGVFTGIFTGKPNSGDITYSLSKSLNGFNAVGNPYPSQINVYNFIDANISNITGTLYFWRKRNDPNATSYATLTKLAYAANSAAGGDTGSSYFNSTSASNWVLNVGQGFFVQATSSSNLLFTNSMRRGTNNGNHFFRTSSKLVEDPSTFKLNLTSTNGVFSQMVLGYSPEYTLGVDDGIDGFNINSTNYLCSTIEGAAYVIQGRPEFSVADIVPLEYKIENADQYSIAIAQLSGVFASQDVFLKDKLTNTIHDLKSGPYDFSSESGNFKERFEVVYENPLAVNQSTFNENSVVVYKQNQELVVNTGKIPMSSVKVYDIRGRLLIAKDHIDATQVKLFTGTTQEVLLVKISSDSYGTVTKKVVN